ncbi:hypothetical protein A6V36_01880 [Paraburkholderia ginsengiterrae]|uniref:Uncharacterized protein n=1 Tax=Paraburkholderia ginsengiterrae TaxID=1462993 RepID=A0A1A9NAZ7_9BURK|nr:hypothetical protein [Paraburkholderia ginsengiterrae]OAJ60568.1 hypothetical protein A6V36_01880 [Paraburkholderia ginsengiterrae]OAJ64122.1 hypothetical protein A6V37_01080 [Paraburkholderia ginsengiterrae]
MSKDFLADDLPHASRQVAASVGVVILIGIALYMLDFQIANLIDDKAISPFWKQNFTLVRSVLENLIAGAFAALILALTYRWIVAFIDPRDRVIEVSPESITERLLKNARRSRNYVFLGNTATFVTAAVLPVLVDAARISGHPRIVKLFLLDPLDEQSVESYSSFKLRVAQTDSKVADINLARWVPRAQPAKGETADEIAAKVTAAIYLAAWSSLQSTMTVTVYLRRSFTPLRADMTDSEVVLTQESAEDSAVAFSSTGHFYGWYHKEADAQQVQATVLDFASERGKVQNLRLAAPSYPVAEIEEAIERLLHGFPHLKNLTARPGMLSLAAKRIANPTHAY